MLFNKGKCFFRRWINSFLFPLTVTSATDIYARSAGCLIKIDERMVFVKDVWSNRWSVPGGGQKSGESEQQTAAREILEETGLQITIDEKLWENERFQLMRCSPTKEIFVSSTPNGLPIIRVPRSAMNEIKMIACLIL